MGCPLNHRWKPSILVVATLPLSCIIVECKATLGLIMIMSMGWDYVSEPRPPTGLFSIPRWLWRAMVLMMPAGETPNSSTRALWQSYQQSHLGARKRNGRRSKNFKEWTKEWEFCLSVSEIPQGIFNVTRILRHGTSGFTSHPRGRYAADFYRP
jgi:hypothetical protein